MHGYMVVILLSPKFIFSLDGVYHIQPKCISTGGTLTLMTKSVNCYSGGAMLSVIMITWYQADPLRWMIR